MFGNWCVRVWVSVCRAFWITRINIELYTHAIVIRRSVRTISAECMPTQNFAGGKIPVISQQEMNGKQTTGGALEKCEIWNGRDAKVEYRMEWVELSKSRKVVVAMHSVHSVDRVQCTQIVLHLHQSNKGCGSDSDEDSNGYANDDDGDVIAQLQESFRCFQFQNDGFFCWRENSRRQPSRKWKRK